MNCDNLPTADLETLRLRARFLAAIRSHFDRRGYWEVDTPLLSHDRVIDAHLEPFTLPGGWRGEDLYLQTSPEFAMKRLLVAGARAIYQLGKVFRRDERGTRHNPEFTMLEWYRVGNDHHAQMNETEALVRSLTRQFGMEPIADQPFARTTYEMAFTRIGLPEIHARTVPELQKWARKQQLTPPPGLADDDRDGWLNWLLAECVEPQLGRVTPENPAGYEFVIDYPPTQAALAVVRPGPEPVAERFELYYRGIELCNGYHELADPEELRSRIQREWETNHPGDVRPPLHSRLLQAMEEGFPACAGVALGVDRLLMILTGKSQLDEVISFPIERA